MSDVADLEHCRELYKLSGWWDAELRCYARYGGGWQVAYVHGEEAAERQALPAYDAGYLLRKLPDDMHSLTYEVTYRLQMKKVDETYFCEYSNHAWFRDMKSVFTRKGYDTSDESLAYGIKPVCADTPENALAQLAIELHKAGILPTNTSEGEV